jgi:protein-S-isoprenylcysteine O-methyltransferase Ste14
MIKAAWPIIVGGSVPGVILVLLLWACSALLPQVPPDYRWILQLAFIPAFVALSAVAIIIMGKWRDRQIRRKANPDASPSA